MRLTLAAANRTLTDGLLSQLAGARLEIYAGARLRSPESALELQQRLAVFALPGFSVPEAGSLNALEPCEATVEASGQAHFGLLLTGDGERLADLTIGEPNDDQQTDLTFDRLDFQRGGVCRLDVLKLTLPTQ